MSYPEIKQWRWKTTSMPTGPATYPSFPASAEHLLIWHAWPYIPSYNPNLALNAFTKQWMWLTPLHSVGPAGVSPPLESLSWPPLTLPKSQPGLGALFCWRISSSANLDHLYSPQVLSHIWCWSLHYTQTFEDTPLYPRHPSNLGRGSHSAIDWKFIDLSSLHRFQAAQY